MSIYKVIFKWKEKEMELMAEKLDMSHPYFVSIKDLYFENSKSLIINPEKDETKRVFGNSRHLMIPFQSVLLIEEIDKNAKDFKIIDKDK